MPRYTEAIVRPVVNEAVDPQKIAKAVREYLERMVRHNTVWEVRNTGDDCVDCPRCRRNQALRYESDRVWRCEWESCRYALPEEFSPPSSQEIRAIFAHMRLEEGQRKFLGLTTSLNVRVEV